MDLRDGYASLSKDVNKVSLVSPTEEGVISAQLPELTLDMDDEKLIALSKDWMKEWEPYKVEIEKKQKENEEYWMGKQFAFTKGDRPLQDNLLFEALETFLPMATRPKADPLVESDNTEAGNALADKVRKMLIHLSDVLSFNLKMKQVARYWALYHLGVLKVGWSMKENDITCKVIRPQKLILEPNSTIEEGEYTGYYIGEHMEDLASDLIERFPEKKEVITKKANDKLGTKLGYILWTTDEYMFWTMEGEVLGKAKNPNWNYETETEVPAPMDEFGVVPTDPMTGQPLMVKQTIPGKNHFNAPKKPYIFLSIFNLGNHPHDDTSLISQNLPLQDLINKRLSQIDINADNANGSIAVSGDVFTEEQASKVASARRKGKTFWVPSGPVEAAIKDIPAQALPTFIYESLLDYRSELRNIFGIRGSTAQGTIREQTVGGKQIIRQQDTDRIGGGISVYLEQFADLTFNWFVQLMYVYYDEEHTAAVLGKEKSKEYIALSNSEFGTKLLVGVKEGSMVPHDPASQRGEAVELWKDKGIDPISFFERLDFPNPRESAKNLYLWMSDPIQLFPDLLQQQQEQQAQEMAAQAEQADGCRG